MVKCNDKTKLLWIKIVHTVIWVIFAASIFYILFAGIFNRVAVLVWVSIGLVILEFIILLICKWRCPLTIIAGRYTDNRSVGFDIFLPAWLAKYNKTIFSILFLVGVALVLWRNFT